MYIYHVKTTELVKGKTMLFEDFYNTVLAACRKYALDDSELNCQYLLNLYRKARTKRYVYTAIYLFKANQVRQERPRFTKPTNKLAIMDWSKKYPELVEQLKEIFSDNSLSVEEMVAKAVKIKPNSHSYTKKSLLEALVKYFNEEETDEEPDEVNNYFGDYCLWDSSENRKILI